MDWSLWTGVYGLESLLENSSHSGCERIFLCFMAFCSYCITYWGLSDPYLK
jgi:hypothetical protein